MLKKVISTDAIITRKLSEAHDMYGFAFQDIDGHLWEMFYMDQSKIKKN